MAKFSRIVHRNGYRLIGLAPYFNGKIGLYNITGNIMREDPKMDWICELPIFITMDRWENRQSKGVAHLYPYIHAGIAIPSMATQVMYIPVSYLYCTCTGTVLVPLYSTGIRTQIHRYYLYCTSIHLPPKVLINTKYMYY